MKYIRNLCTLLLVLALGAGNQSCTNWLDVQPKDQVLENQAFESEIRINETLNGLYFTMAHADLYGKNLTFFTTELMAQRYNFPVGAMSVEYNVRANLVKMEYTEKLVKEHFDEIFAKGYNFILNINKFIKKLEATEGKVTDAEKNLMLGEAYALRAYMHFDLLRLFGPVPAQSDLPAIPYVIQPNNDWQSRKTFTAVMAELHKDLDKALELLANDPIRTTGVIKGADSDNEDSDFFYTDYRNRRMNYYAARMLKARVLAWEDKKTDAGALAVALITDAGFQKAFPWAVDFKEAEGGKMFSDEVVFGFKVSDMYSEWETYFSPAITNLNSLLGAHRSNILYMFNSTDDVGYLATQDWRKDFYTINTDGDYFLSNKFRKTAATQDYTYFQPLMRKSELYLLASEITLDEQYINEVRGHRGLKSLAVEFENRTYVLAEQIEKEMMKETTSEGQLLYYYKRLNKSAIRSYNGSGTDGMRTVAASNYIAPYPAAEKNP